MKIYKPYRTNVLAEIIEFKTSIILPGDNMGKWVRLKVIAVGLDVKENIKPGMVVLAENMFNQIDPVNKNIGLILAQYIHIEEREDGKSES